MSGVAVVIGAGDDTGSAIAKAFAVEGLKVCVVRRPRHIDSLNNLVTEIEGLGASAHAFGIDARDEEQMTDLFNTIESDVGGIEVVVFNIGANVSFSIEETSARVYRKVWEMACFAGFLSGREAARKMRPRNKGTIIFTGATASLRAGKNYSAFAGAKFALRALAQSMAKELGPENIHVAHVVIDGAIDSSFIRENLANVDDLRDEDAILSTNDIAENFVWLHKQKRTAWTHELDLRPWKEHW